MSEYFLCVKFSSLRYACVSGLCLCVRVCVLFFVLSCMCFEFCLICLSCCSCCVSFCFLSQVFVWFCCVRSRVLGVVAVRRLAMPSMRLFQGFVQ